MGRWTANKVDCRSGYTVNGISALAITSELILMTYFHDFRVLPRYGSELAEPDDEIMNLFPHVDGASYLSPRSVALPEHHRGRVESCVPMLDTRHLPPSGLPARWFVLFPTVGSQIHVSREGCLEHHPSSNASGLD